MKLAKQDRLDPRDIAFDKAITDYLNSGGTIAGAYARLQAAARMSGRGQPTDAINGPQASAPTRPPLPSEGPICRADNSQSNSADAGRTNEDAEAGSVVPQGHAMDASASSPARGGNGHARIASSGQCRSAVSVREHTRPFPVREPSKSQIEAMRLVKLSLLDTFKVRDGRAIGDVRYGELDRLRNRDIESAAVIRQIQKKIGYADHDRKVRDLITADELNAMTQKAAEIADAV